MKPYPYSLLLCLLLVFLNSHAAEKPYDILLNVKDKTLSDTDAIVTFTFINQHKEPLQIPVTASYNGNLFLRAADANGNIIMPLKPGKYTFIFLYKKGILPDYMEEDTYGVSTDSIQVDAAHRMIIRINLGDVPSEKEKDHEVVKKPVLYFYPTQKQAIHVVLKPKGQLLFSYPLYNNGWSFTGEPNGNIDLNGKQYRYLFWEAATDNLRAHFQPTQGFVVAQTDLLGFLEEKLEAMGLSAAEQQDFITYWYPQMADNAYSYIHFMFNQSCDNIAELRISPQPEMLFRVYMLWSELPEQTLLQPTAQDMPTLKREGFHVVEWGGVELSPSVLFPTTQR